MNFLLDTHILLWWLADNSLLTKKERFIISDKKNTIYVSSVSIWEINIKKRIGKLHIPDNLIETIQEYQFKELPISWKHTEYISFLPNHHSDPFDRMLIAQTRIDNLTLITADQKLLKYNVDILSRI